MARSALFVSRVESVHDRRFLDALVSFGYETSYRPLTAGGAGSRDPRNAAVHYDTPFDVSSPSDAGAAVAQFLELYRRLGRPLVVAGPVQTGGLIAALAGVPFVVMSWGHDMLIDVGRGGPWHDATVRTLSAASLAVCDCETVRMELLAHGLSPVTPVVTLPYGIELSRFGGDVAHARFREDFGIPIGGTAFLSLRSWEPTYGVLELLEGFRLAAMRDPDIHLVLAGGGSLQSQVTDKLGEVGLAGRVTRVGWLGRDGVVQALAATDVMLSMSEQDGSSISLLEAMASERPVVVTDNRSNREWVDDSRGRLCAALDPAVLAEMVLEFGEMSSDERERMGRSGRVEVEKRADWGKNFSGLEHAFDTVWRVAQGG
jgi:glycosyltransferase involved in cell wall biosynthesis